MRGGEGWLLCCDILYYVYSRDSKHHPKVGFYSAESARGREREKEREGPEDFLKREKIKRTDRFHSLSQSTCMYTFNTRKIHYRYNRRVGIYIGVGGILATFFHQ